MSYVEILDPLDGEWKNIAPMKTARIGLAAVNYGGVIYAIGGKFRDEDFRVTETVEKYDPSANSWEYVKNMNFKRHGHAPVF